ncbi:conserved hypothetical protein [Oscillibacter sp. PC13]|uniref:peptidoglycan editing factor PgeF n=1 Tax=Oscillibacter sp. PC13 TaxID=1855299 RepID=UPI0008EA3890|nr:peptidoglycan editing factor PgeF [Oscillibacter sp. PC13]SFP03410.1 conserved hypothetical protein [Oscillibacter sp. PC13]
MPFKIHEESGLVWLTSSMLSGVHHGFSTRQGGVSSPPFDSLNLGIGRGDDLAAVQENYRRFCTAVGTSPKEAVLSQQTHSSNIRTVTQADAGKGLLCQRDYRDVDALITRVPGLALTVFSADCGILLLYDPIQNAAGAVHAGWRGCAAGIAEKTVRAMGEQFGSAPCDLLAAIGPCIQLCCFETDADVPEAMRRTLGADAEPYLQWRAPKWHVDLAGLNRQWLLRAGLLPSHIENSGLCTACRPDLFWSHRKMGEARGAQVAMISLNSPV